MKNTITMIGVIIVLMLSMVTAQQMPYRPTVLPELVYGMVELSNGQQANEATYTITTLNSTGATLSTLTGTVGTMKLGYIFESQNKVSAEGDKLVIEVNDTANNQTGRLEHVVTDGEYYKSYVNFGTMKLTPVSKPCEIYGNCTCEDYGNCSISTPELYLHSVRFVSDEYLVIGEDLITRALLDNVGNADLEDVKVNVLIADLGVRRSVGPFTIDDDDNTDRKVYIQIPDWSQPGEYDVRITISNDDMHRVVYRKFVVEPTE
jgi:hypothetical protein